MKRLLAFILICMLLCAPALACDIWWTGDWVKVADCEEYISLRSEPSTSAEVIDRIPLGASTLIYLRPYDGTFTEVLYEGRSGYVMSKYLRNLFAVCEDCADYDLHGEELYNVNLFLTNFTEQGMLSPDGLILNDTMEDHQLVDFAIEHIWYNRQDLLEWGEYEDGNNVRLNKKHIPAVCEKYFGRIPENLDLSHYDVDGDYYYWAETGGHVPFGFAHLHNFRDMGNGRYRVNFCVYGAGMGWEEDVYSMDERELARTHPEYYTGYPYPYGNAIINVNGGSLLDRSTWTLERLAMDW